jgi:ubiquinone/menaquinone biosynthesis C-methylase UbiE
MTLDTDYVLGTHDEEIARLGIQHQVWRPHMLDAWARAGMTRGSRVVDFGAGPGYATCHAAEIVGPRGHVTAVERSPHFLAFAVREMQRRNMSWISFIESDLMADGLSLAGFDVAWCRWVASFVSSPPLLLSRIAASLRAGGRAVLHEYQDYSTWRMIPDSQSLTEFVTQVMVSWRNAGGEPNVVAKLLPLMPDEGLRVISLKPLIFAARPTDFAWQWPASFAVSNSERLVEVGLMQRAAADQLQSDFRECARNPNAVMMTPLVLEIIAEKQ